MTETVQGRGIAGRSDGESVAIQVLNFIVADVDRIIQLIDWSRWMPLNSRDLEKPSTSTAVCSGTRPVA